MDETAMIFAVRLERTDLEKLRVPVGFEEVLEDGFLNVELLLDGGEESWCVTLVHEEADVGWKKYLDVGWSDFVDENALNIGDVLMFKWEGDNTFTVQIIYCTGVPWGLGTGQSYDSGGIGKKRGRKAVLEGGSAKMIQANTWLDQLSRVCGEACFKFSFTKEYFRQSIINVPLSFAKAHFMGFPSTTKVKLQHFDTQFDVELKVVRKENKIIQCSLKNGVRKFIEHYNVHKNTAALFKYREGILCKGQCNLSMASGNDKASSSSVAPRNVPFSGHADCIQIALLRRRLNNLQTRKNELVVEMAELQKSMLQVDEDILQTGRMMEELQDAVDVARRGGQHLHEEAAETKSEHSVASVNDKKQRF